MNLKLFLFGALVMVCATFSSCELLGGGGDDRYNEPTGTATFQWDGGETFDLANVIMTNHGETDIPGIYATVFYLRMTSSTDESVSMSGNITIFHASETLAPGTYPFPSSLSGTAQGDFSWNERYGNVETGSVAVSVSGETYTITLSGVTAGEYDAGTDRMVYVPVTGSYTGEVIYEDVSTDEDRYKPRPQNNGQGEFEEKVSGLTFKVTDMSITYHGVTKTDGLHVNTLYLVAANEEKRFDAGFSIYSDSRELKPGTYTAPGCGVGNFDSWFNLDNRERPYGTTVLEGTVVVAETNGIYTVTLNDVAGSMGNGANMNVDGTYTGRSNFADESENTDPEYLDTRYTGTSTFTVGDTALRIMEVSGSNDGGETRIVAAAFFMRPESPDNGYRTVSVEFTINGDELTPGTHRIDGSNVRCVIVDSSISMDAEYGMPYTEFEKQTHLWGGTLTVSQDATGKWELELSGTSTDSAQQPSFNGKYTGRINIWQ